MKRAVFLDRDGVINRACVREGRPYPPSSCDELEILPGAAEAIASLRAAGFLVIVVTNQPDVATGRQRREVVDAIHARIRQKVPLDDLKVCFHSDEDRCACRKPQPGLLLEAAQHWGVDLSTSYLVGDRWRDIEAGKAAGCRTILVGYEYDERRAAGYWAVVPSLLDASALILAELADGRAASAAPTADEDAEDQRSAACSRPERAPRSSPGGQR